MSDEPIITTHAELRLLSPEQIIEARNAGRLDLEAIAADRARTVQETRRVRAAQRRTAQGMSTDPAA